MISEGSCDTEDWSNDAENSALQCSLGKLSNIILCNDIIINYLFNNNNYYYYYVLNYNIISHSFSPHCKWIYRNK